MTAKLEIHLLGHLRALVDGAPLPLKFPPRTGPLWAYLLLHRGSRLQRNALAYILWPDESEVDARTNLRRHLHQLSRALRRAAAQEPCLFVDRASVTWNLEADFWLDVDEFERLSAAPETLAEAVNLYAGRFPQGPNAFGRGWFARF